MRQNRKESPVARDPFVSVAAAARALGISRPTVHARVSAGLLEAQQVAGRTVITRESLDALVAQQKPQTAAA